MHKPHQQQREYPGREPWAPRPGEPPMPGFQNERHFLGEMPGYPSGPNSGNTYTPRRGGANPGDVQGGDTYNDFPAHAGRGAASRQDFRHRGVAPRGYKRSDERILEDVCERLMHDGLDCGGMEVTVRSGIVGLVGEAARRSDKHRIEQLAADVPGVSDVDNQLRVRGRSSGDASRPEPAAGSPPSGIAGAVIKGTSESEGTSRSRE